MNKTKVLIITGIVLVLSFFAVRYFDTKPKQQVEEKRPQATLVAEEKQLPSQWKSFDSSLKEVAYQLKPHWTIEFDGDYEHPTMKIKPTSEGRNTYEFRLEEVRCIMKLCKLYYVEDVICCIKCDYDDCIIAPGRRTNIAELEGTTNDKLMSAFAQLKEDWKYLNKK